MSLRASPEEIDSGHGTVSGAWLEPDAPSALLVMGHGAGADIHHAHMQSIADALAARQIATLRFNFPFMQARKRRTDPLPICLATISAAVTTAASLKQDVPLFLGGHSFGGRMASHYAAGEPHEVVRGLVYFSFPLHSANKPDTRRAQHLGDISLPQLFLSGTRDALGDLSLLRDVTGQLTHAHLHEIETADHSFKILKRTRKSEEDVYDEAARVVKDFIATGAGILD